MSSDRLRLGCMKKSSSLPQISDLGIPYFFTCHTCLTSPHCLRLERIEKIPGREKPKSFKPKGNERVSERREMLAYLCRA